MLTRSRATTGPSPDNDVPFLVGLMNGQTVQIASPEIRKQLAEQNRMRKELGLNPLPGAVLQFTVGSGPASPTQPGS